MLHSCIKFEINFNQHCPMKISSTQPTITLPKPIHFLPVMFHVNNHLVTSSCLFFPLLVTTLCLRFNLSKYQLPLRSLKNDKLINFNLLSDTANSKSPCGKLHNNDIDVFIATQMLANCPLLQFNRIKISRKYSTFEHATN